MPVLTEKLAELYQFREEKEVERFLEENPYLIPLLIEARDQIAKYFGPETPVGLEVFHDWEDEEDEGELFALIQSKLPFEEACKRREKFTREWWLPNDARGRYRLNIDLEWT